MDTEADAPPVKSRRIWLGIALALVTVLAGAVLLVAALALYDFAWGSPQENSLVLVEAVKVSPGAVALKGTTASSALHYRRHTVRFRDGRMTVRLRWSLLNSRGGAFDITIPTDGEQVDEVYLSDGSAERRLYP